MQLAGDDLVYAVTVTAPDGLKIKLYYNQKTGLKVRETIDRPGASMVDFTDYRIVNGIQIPFTQKTSFIGMPVDFKVKNAEIQ